MELTIKTRNNFKGAHGKDIIIEGMGSFFLTSHQIRKGGGLAGIKQLIKEGIVYHDDDFHAVRWYVVQEAAAS